MRRTVFLPWPDKALSPNGRVHWAAKARATKAARQDAQWLCAGAGVPKGQGATLTFTYYPPDSRRRDAQNMPAMLKAAIDGIADHIGCDDSSFVCMFPGYLGPVRKGGAIQVDIEVNE